MLASKHPESDLCLWQISHRQEIISGTCWWHTEWLSMCLQRFLLFADSHVLGTIFMWMCAKHSSLLYFCLLACLLVCFYFPPKSLSQITIFSPDIVWNNLAGYFTMWHPLSIWQLPALADVLAPYQSRICLPAVHGLELFGLKDCVLT